MLACTQGTCSGYRYLSTHQAPISGPKINHLPSAKNLGMQPKPSHLPRLCCVLTSPGSAWTLKQVINLKPESR